MISKYYYACSSVGAMSLSVYIRQNHHLLDSLLDPFSFKITL